VGHTEEPVANSCVLPALSVHFLLEAKWSHPGAVSFGRIGTPLLACSLDKQGQRAIRALHIDSSLFQNRTMKRRALGPARCHATLLVLSTPLRASLTVTGGQLGHRRAARQTSHILFFVRKVWIFSPSLERNECLARG
jgi:hypothetical protein